MNVASRRGRQDSSLPLPKMCHRSLLQMLQSPWELFTRLSSRAGHVQSLCCAEPTFRPLQDTQLGDSAKPAACAIPCTLHQACTTPRSALRKVCWCGRQSAFFCVLTNGSVCGARSSSWCLCPLAPQSRCTVGPPSCIGITGAALCEVDQVVIRRDESVLIWPRSAQLRQAHDDRCRGPLHAEPAGAPRPCVAALSMHTGVLRQEAAAPTPPRTPPLAPLSRSGWGRTRALPASKVCLSGKHCPICVRNLLTCVGGNPKHLTACKRPGIVAVLAISRVTAPYFLKNFSLGRRALIVMRLEVQVALEPAHKAAHNTSFTMWFLPLQLTVRSST